MACPPHVWIWARRPKPKGPVVKVCQVCDTLAPPDTPEPTPPVVAPEPA